MGNDNQLPPPREEPPAQTEYVVHRHASVQSMLRPSKAPQVMDLDKHRSGRGGW